MFKKYIDQILKIFKYVDSALITDNQGIICYYYTGRNDVNGLKKEQVVGKHILSVFDNLTCSTSTVIQVLHTGKPILNQRQELVTYNGCTLSAITSTLPITEGGKMIGTIDVSSYSQEPMTVSKERVKSDGELYTIDDIVSLSEEMIELKEKIRKVSSTDSSVLIYGETGTGKELVAQSIHTAGNRKDKPFVSQNCSAIPETLLESILFGTVKGSFTGAENRMGLFEMANGGTLFLDEINSMEMPVQSKLLKAIEEKSITRIGGNKSIRVDVKIISATNEKIDGVQSKAKIRQDLLYRLSVVRLNIPPLRERMIDVGPLSRNFISLFNYKMGKNITDLDDIVYELFNMYDWPGNVRELKSAIESGFNLSSGRIIGMNDLPEYLIDQIKSKACFANENYNGSLRQMVEDYEREIIEKTLAQTVSRAEAAEKLKVSKQTFNYKLKKYNLW